MVKKKTFRQALKREIQDNLQYDNFSNIDFNNGAMFTIEWILKYLGTDLITTDRDGERCIEEVIYKSEIEKLLE